jgi:hypothetical protein
MPKGGEIKAKATGSATTCDFFKDLSVSVLGFLIKTFLLQKFSLIGEKFDYGKRGSFWLS